MDPLSRGAAAFASGDWDAAEELYIEAVARGLLSLGGISLGRGQFAAAELHYREILRLAPQSAHAAFNLSTLLLSLGRYAEGWPLYEARRRVAGFNTPPGPEAIPEWQGEDLRGKRIVVIGEQGLGDQIMFARFLPELERRGARYTYVCTPAVAPIVPGAVSTLVTEAAAIDCWTHVGSLPFRLGVTLENMPPPLTLETGVGGAGIGVVTRGGPVHARDASRSLDPDSSHQLLAIGRDLHPDATGATSFAETADIIAGLDLVVTVDTSVAHLAGSMRKPVWILLPHPYPDWRWGRMGSTTPWYPSARLFRQSTPGDWRSVIDAIRAEVAT